MTRNCPSPGVSILFLVPGNLDIGEDPKESSVSMRMGSDIQTPGGRKTKASDSTEEMPKHGGCFSHGDVTVRICCADFFSGGSLPPSSEPPGPPQ